MANGKNDPANYRAMSIPHDNLDAANAAWSAFYADVFAARQRHRIADVLVVAALNFSDEGKEQSAPVCSSMGNPRTAAERAAFAYGHETNEHDRRLAEAIKGGLTAKAGKK